jgi:putative ABC transport system substrate-binding protein
MSFLKIIRPIIAIIAVTTLCSCTNSQQSSNVKPTANKILRIAIFSPLYHASLTSEITGFKVGLSDKGYREGQNVKFLDHNGNGEFNKMVQLIESIYAERPDLLFVVTTPAATEAANLCKKYKIPTIYGAVTDPVKAKIVDSMEASSLPITGVSDRYPVKQQSEFYSLFFKNKQNEKAAILYTPGEENSQILSSETNQYLKECGIASERIAISTTQELAPILETIMNKYSFIIVNGDNAIIEKISVVSNLCNKHKKPLFVGDPMSVKQGALAALGPDYYSMGIDAANKAVRIIEGEDAGKIPSSFPKSFEYAVNVDIANKYGFNIPSTVWQKSKIWKTKDREE